MPTEILILYPSLSGQGIKLLITPYSYLLPNQKHQRMQKAQAAIEATLNHYLQAFANNDMSELMKDYTEDSEVWTPNGTFTGLEAISSFFQYVFALMPKEGTQLEVKYRMIKDEKAYIVWTADSPAIQVPMGTDSFEIRDDKIIWQSTAAHITHK